MSVLGEPIDLSVVITHRNADPHREPNLRAVLRHLRNLPRTEVIVVEQDRRPRLDRSDLGHGLEYVFAFNPDGFNKSWGVNIGAVRARGGILLIADGDLLIEHWALVAAMQACKTGATAVNPYRDVVNLTESDSALLCAGQLDLVQARTRGTDRVDSGEHPCFCGGSYFIDTEFYRRIGGQDERFQGWGAEDNAMSIRLLQLTSRAIMLSDSTACHLYHSRHPGRYQHPEYLSNMKLLASYEDMDLEQLRIIGATGMGDPDKYRRQTTPGRGPTEP